MNLPKVGAGIRREEPALSLNYLSFMLTPSLSLCLSLSLTLSIFHYLTLSLSLSLSQSLSSSLPHSLSLSLTLSLLLFVCLYLFLFFSLSLSPSLSLSLALSLTQLAIRNMHGDGSAKVWRKLLFRVKVGISGTYTYFWTAPICCFFKTCRASRCVSPGLFFLS